MRDRLNQYAAKLGYAPLRGSTAGRGGGGKLALALCQGEVVAVPLPAEVRQRVAAELRRLAEGSECPQELSELAGYLELSA